MADAKHDEMNAHSLLGNLSQHIQGQYVDRNTILSFDEFFDIFMEHPIRFSRSTYQYLVDMIDHYGMRDLEDDEQSKGYKIFDQSFNDNKGAVWGQAAVQYSIVQLLKGFSRVGRADKLILLHGPNGSAKSSLVQCLMKGLEAYSMADEGTVFRFNWIFPEEKITREKIGFSKEDKNTILAGESFARLPEDRISARLSCPLRDNPIFLIPRTEREQLFEELINLNDAFAGFELSEFLMDGELSPMNRMIFDTLLSAYCGDYRRVMQHVQVERYYFSERYKVGAVTIEPQMSVDARIQQLTADRSLSSLPPVLQNLSIFEPSGHLVQANHGVVEYSDLLKRPVDAYKYLLGTCEKGTINLDTALIYLDLVMVGSSNDRYLEAFKQAPDFTSFKGRMELVRVPYLLDFTDEMKIYDNQLDLESQDKHLTPYLTEIVSLWSVLTRLRHPKAENYPDELRPVIENLNPLDKALFYAKDEVPEWTSVTQAKQLKGLKKRMLFEFNEEQIYEGSYGASPREGKMILQSAVQGDSDGCISASRVFSEIRKLIKNPSVHDWLQMEPDGIYGDQERLLQYVEEYYIAKVDKEIKIAMEMIHETQYIDLLERYVEQASAWIQGSKVSDPISGQEREVDEGFLKEVEIIIAPSDSAKAFRQEVVSRVGAFALDHPNQPVDYLKVFHPQIARIEQHYFTRQQKRIAKMHENLMKSMTGRDKELVEEEKREVADLLSQMKHRFGYAHECTQAVVNLLMRTRYKESEPEK